MIRVSELNAKQYFSETKEIADNIFQTKEWFSYLQKTIKGKPVFLKYENDENVLYLHGFVFSMFGIKIFASPFEKWTTPYIGLIVAKKNEKFCLKDCVNSFYSYLKRNYKIWYFEITDLNISEEESIKNKLKFDKIMIQCMGLEKSEEELISSFKRSVKKRIKNYEKHDLSIEKVEPTEKFVELYYEQLIEVFELQGKSPFYTKEKVHSLIEAYKDSENILCLVSKQREQIIGSAISFGYKGKCITWGSASYTATKHLNMNHCVRWESMRHWKENGCVFYDFGGYNPYKDCFNPTEKNIIKIYKERIFGIHLLKNTAKKIIGALRKS